MNTKKLFIISIILFALVAGSLLVYNLFFQKPATNSANQSPLPSTPADKGSFDLPNEQNNSGQENQAGSSENNSTAQLRLKPISQEKVLAPTIGSDGKTVKYYTISNSNVYESDFNGGNLKKISSTVLNRLTKIIWSPDKEKVIGILSENGYLKKYFYNYTNGQSSIFNEKIGYIAWSPDSKKVAYQFTDPSSEQSNISLSNPDGSNYKNIFKTRLDNLIVEWPSRNKISLRQPASGLSQGILYAISVDTGDFNKILSDLFGLNAKWSPSADKILYSSTNNNGKNPKLFLADETGANSKDLKIAGIADKCAWGKDGKTIFCAIPQKISSNAIWPDDYYKGLVILSDDFYKINLETNEQIKIAGSSDQIGYDAQELFLSPKEDYLFFVNRKDGRLYSLKI